MTRRTSTWHQPEARRAYRKKNRARILQRVRIRKYGISLEELRGLEQEADGKCMICRRKRPLVLDHNHKTDEWRGLICRKCNAAIGFLDDNPKLVVKAARYLLERR
jgi:hypothetical protein